MFLANDADVENGYVPCQSDKIIRQNSPIVNTCLCFIWSFFCALIAL